MTRKPPFTVELNPEQRAAAGAEITPEFLAQFDALTDEDVAGQIAANPDAAPELDEAWFDRAQLVIPLGAARRPLATAVRFDEARMWVDLEDGRTLGVPIDWYPRLLHGAPALRDKVTISAGGLHWEELNEDISIAGLLAGQGNRTHRGKRAA